jgi:hypothetical protein
MMSLGYSVIFSFEMYAYLLILCDVLYLGPLLVGTIVVAAVSRHDEAAGIRDDALERAVGDAGG